MINAAADMEVVRNRSGSRTRTQARPAPFSSASSGPGHRPPHGRTLSHSTTLGSHLSNNRVARRKSSIAPSGVNRAAVVAAINGSMGQPASSQAPSRHSHFIDGYENLGSPSGPSTSAQAMDHSAMHDSSAIDESFGSYNTFQTTSPTKNRNRRASDGSVLGGDSKRGTMRELRCETCGKGYKHSSCLTKHLWEHTPEWQLTSKLLISKHQQVQLLEAASVLVAMNKEEAISSEEAKDLSDQSSTSPAQSGSSNPYNGLSSQETTPPPFSDSSSAYPESSLNRWAVRSQSNRDYPMRYSYGGEFSVGSAPSLLSPIHDASPGQSPFPGHLGMPTGVRGGEDMAGLAAAIEMLSSNFQTPESRPHHPDTGVPPVPALPSHFQPYRKEINLHSQQPIDFPLSSTGISHRQSFTRGTSGNQLGTSRKEDMDDHVFGRMDE